jgi:Tol biopolymer transport system component
MLTRPLCPGLLAILVLLTSVSSTLAGESEKPTYRGQVPLMIMSIDGKELHQLTYVPGYEVCGSPMWSHDGTQVAFDACGGNYLDNHVFVVGIDGSSPRDLGRGAMPSWAPGDQRLVFHRSNGNWGLWAMQPDGTGLEQLTTHGSSARWSPDGVQIAHLSHALIDPARRGEHGIVVYSTLEGATQSLLSDGELGPRFNMTMVGFQWSPDGRRLGLIAARHDGGYGLFIYTLDGPERGLKRRLETERDRMELGVAWSPDGKEVLIPLQTEADRASQLYRLEVDTEAAPVRLPGQDPDRSAGDVAWSPDGKWVLFASSPAH